MSRSNSAAPAIITQTISFEVAGVQVRGTWHLQEDAAPEAAVVLAHGFAGTAYPSLGRYARLFAARGLGALTFDYRSFGASGGKPRQVLDIAAQHADWRGAITWAREQVDRVGLWGTLVFRGTRAALGGDRPRHRRGGRPSPFL